MFPRDGTSCCPFVPGQKKYMSWCPFVPGQGQKQKSQDKMNFKKKSIKDQISCFRTSPSCFRTSFPVLERPFCSVPLCHAFHPEFWLSRPVLFQILALPSRTLARFIACPRCLFVPKSCTVPSRWKHYCIPTILDLGYLLIHSNSPNSYRVYGQTVLCSF